MLFLFPGPPGVASLANRCYSARMSDRRLSRLAWIVTALGLALLFMAMLFTVMRAPAGPLPSEPTTTDTKGSIRT